MKIRLCMLGFAVLLLSGAWARAQAPAADPASSGAAPFCAASMAGLEKGTDLTPPPLFKAVTCGPCSAPSCVGQTLNSTCFYLAGGTYQVAKCVINSVCLEDNSPYCDCTNNPPD